MDAPSPKEDAPPTGPQEPPATEAARGQMIGLLNEPPEVAASEPQDAAPTAKRPAAAEAGAEPAGAATEEAAAEAAAAIDARPTATKIGKAQGEAQGQAQDAAMAKAAAEGIQASPTKKGRAASKKETVGKKAGGAKAKTTDARKAKAKGAVEPKKKSKARAKDGIKKKSTNRKRKAKGADRGGKAPSKTRAGADDAPPPKKRAKKASAAPKGAPKGGYRGVSVAPSTIAHPWTAGTPPPAVRFAAVLRRGGREYPLGAYALAADAAVAHDAAHRITASSHGDALARGDAEGIERALGWLDRTAGRGATKGDKEPAEEEGVNFARPAQYRAARKKELHSSGGTASEVPTEEELKLQIRREVLTLAQACAAAPSDATEEVRSGPDPADGSDDGSSEPKRQKRKAASALSKKKAWTPDDGTSEDEDDVTVQAHALLALQSRGRREDKKEALARKLERMMAGGGNEASSSAAAAGNGGAAGATTAASSGLAQSLLDLAGSAAGAPAQSLPQSLLVLRQRQDQASMQARLEMAVRESVGAMFGSKPTVAAKESAAESNPEAEAKPAAAAKQEAEAKIEGEAKQVAEAKSDAESTPDESMADLGNNGDDEDAKVKSLLASMSHKGPVPSSLADQLKAALKQHGMPENGGAAPLDDEDDDPQAAMERRLAKEAKREALADKLSALMGGGGDGNTAVKNEETGAQESSRGDGNRKGEGEKGEASSGVAPNLQRQQALQLQTLQSLQGLSAGANAAGTDEQALLQSILLKKQAAETNKAVLEQTIGTLLQGSGGGSHAAPAASLEDLALPQGLQSDAARSVAMQAILENQRREQQLVSLGNNALMEEAVRRRAVMERILLASEESRLRQIREGLQGRLNGGALSHLGATSGLGGGPTLGAGAMTNEELRRALLVSEMNARAAEQRLQLELRARDMALQQALAARSALGGREGISSDALLEAAHREALARLRTG